MKFNELKIKEPILKAIEDKGYVEPTKIQEQAIDHIIDNKDVLGCAQTGTGKTAAFAIPILNNLEKEKYIQALILTPTRELAIQIKENFDEYGKYLKLKSTVIFGGVSQRGQEKELRAGTDILIATPGRLLDLMNQKIIKLSQIKVLVLDEADNMLDMGFIKDIKKVIKVIPKERQTLLFSATMPKEIKVFADEILTNPLEVTVASVSSTVDTVTQSVYSLDSNNKANLLVDILRKDKPESTLVFTRTKHGADKVVKILQKAGFTSGAIHGNKSQNYRQKTLKDFKDGNLKVLVATDIAARGLDINYLAMVINYEIPNIPETYVHRIGRTGRAGQSGVSISFVNFEEQAYLKDIEKLIKKKIDVVEGHKYPLTDFTIKPKSQGGGNRRTPKAGSRDNGFNQKSGEKKKFGGSNNKSKDRKATYFKPKRNTSSGASRNK